MAMSDKPSKVMSDIGYIISAWSLLEISFVRLLESITKIDFTRSYIILLSHRSFQSQKKLIIDLAKPYLPEEQYDYIVGLLTDAEKLEYKRNLLAHGVISFDESEDSIMLIKPKKCKIHGVSMEVYKLPEDFGKLRDDILEISKQISEIVSHITPSELPKGTINLLDKDE